MPAPSSSTERGRGRLSGIELLPEPCAPIVQWAAQELQNRDRSQLDIYREFVARLEAIDREFRGELQFTVPSFSAFNRYSLKLAALSQRLNQTREIAATLADRYDGKASDDTTIIAAELLKVLVFEMLSNAGESGLDPKGARDLGAALRAAIQAQGVSTERKIRMEKVIGEKVGHAVDAVEKAGRAIDKAEILRIIREAYSGA